MPISTNAPFNDLGHSMVLRDIEQLWLSLQDTDAALRGITSGDMNGGGGAIAGQSNPNDALGGPGSQLRNGDTAGGDLSGTYPDPMVVGLRGIPISSTPPLYGQALFFNGSSWAPQSPGQIHFLGTLDFPVFANGGNARGTSAVDWQQVRSANTQVASGQYSTIIGGENNTASGFGSVAGGGACTASGGGSISLGSGATASGDEGVALGHSVTASSMHSVAIGHSSTAHLGDGAVAIGHSATAGGQYAVAFSQAAATAIGSFAAGVSAAAGASDAFALGNTAIATGSLAYAIGGSTTASHDQAMVLGYSASSSMIGELVLGFLRISTQCDFYRGGTRILTTQQAAVTAPTGGATVDSQSRTAINDIISRLQAHGLIA